MRPNCASVSAVTSSYFIPIRCAASLRNFSSGLLSFSGTKHCCLSIPFNFKTFEKIGVVYSFTFIILGSGAVWEEDDCSARCCWLQKMRKYNRFRFVSIFIPSYFYPTFYTLTFSATSSTSPNYTCSFGVNLLLLVLVRHYPGTILTKSKLLGTVEQPVPEVANLNWIVDNIWKWHRWRWRNRKEEEKTDFGNIWE